jgi:hypothetical protein
LLQTIVHQFEAAQGQFEVTSLMGDVEPFVGTAEGIGDEVRKGLVEWDHWSVRILGELEEGLDQPKEVYDFSVSPNQQGWRSQKVEEGLRPG